MAHWAHGGGFSVDGSVRIEATDRATTQRTRRGPPLWDATDAEHDPAADPLRQCAPAFEFDQRIAS